MHSCTAAYDLLESRWEAWKAGEGARYLDALEANSFNQQYKIMQDAYQEWRAWEFRQDPYISSAVEIQECAVGVPVMQALESGAGITAMRKHEACRLGGCKIKSCVKVKTHCTMGRPSGEVTFECFDRS